jgi:hypothetical protein
VISVKDVPLTIRSRDNLGRVIARHWIIGVCDQLPCHTDERAVKRNTDGDIEYDARLDADLGQVPSLEDD